MRNIFLWLVIKAVSAFNLTCPHPGQWNYTAEAKNCSITNYICLLADIVADVELEITEDCRPGPRRERKGFKTELNKGNFNRKNCSSKHFQPFKFSSLKNSRCVFEKSNCSEEGQVSSDNGTSIRDVRCRCNYLKGYAFLANTSNLCSCIPSEEDCTCFKKSCSDTEILSPDYNCIDETKPQGTYQCSSISDEDLKPVTNVTPVGSVPIVYDKVNRYLAASFCTFLVVLKLVLVYCWRRSNKIIFSKQLEDQNCFQSDSVTFTCVINQENIPGRWTKDGQELKSSESRCITVVGRIHKLVLDSVTVNDSGRYSCHIKDKISSSKLTVKEVIISEQLEEQNCFVSDSVTFTCEVDQENVPGRWTKDEQELKPSESRHITVVGRIHKLVFDSVTVNDSGNYSCHIKDKISSSKLTVKEVIFSKQLEGQNCFQSDSVTLTCVINQENIPGRWTKDGQELKSAESRRITVVGRIHKLVFDSVTVNDSGKYSCHIKDKNSSSKLAVKEVIISKQLEEQNCFQSDSVTFICEVDQENVPGRWIKDGQELKSSESRHITVVGKTHELVLDSVTVNDSGNYSCHIKDKISSSKLAVKEVFFSKQLEGQNCFQSDSVTFTCEVNHVDIPGRWTKDGQELKPSESRHITVVGRSHKLVLDSVTVNDSGNYSCHIKDKNNSAQLTVEGVIASSSSSVVSGSLRTNYARIGHAAQQLFPDILQELITITVPPQRLSHDVNTNYYLSKMLRSDEWWLINNVVTKGYANFDISLIYKLIRNLKLVRPPTKGWDYSTAPSPTEVTTGDDIERIRRFREKIHKGNAEVTDTELSQYFTEFKNIAGRLQVYLRKRPGEYVDKFVDLETCCMDEKTHDIYIRRIERLKKRLYAIEKDADALKENRTINFIKHLEDQSCYKGGSVTFTCEVNQNDILARWRKDGKELKPSKSINITAVGKVHILVIHSVTATDSGNYSCHILDKNSSAQLTVKEVRIIKGLEDHKCIEGDQVTITCELNHENIPARWNKDGQEVKPSDESISITSNGNKHILVVHSVTANDSGNYSCHILDKNSSAQLTVKEVTITKPIEDLQQHIEGDKVTFTCEVNSEVLPGTWFKDGQELSCSDNLDIKANGRIRGIVIHRVTVDDRGYYSFNIDGKSSGGLLFVLDEFTPDKINYIRLYHLLETVAEPVVRKIFDSEIHPNQLRKILNQNRNITDKLKHQKHINIREYHLLYPRGVEYSVKFMINNYDCKRINQNKEENLKLKAEIECAVLDLYSNDEGDHKVKVVSFESGSLIVVLQLKSTSDEQDLKKILKTAVDKGKVGSFETESTGFKFTRLGNVQAASKDFDIRLMMVLMKNLTELNIADVFPHKDDLTVVADLSRIKYLRNKIAQNSDKSITDEDFDKDWKHLSEAVERLGSVADKKMCEELKSLRPTLQHVQEYLNTENLQRNQGHTSNDSIRDLFLENEVINLFARDAVRRIFDKQFPPLRLETEIEPWKKELAVLTEERKITQSQWDDLFPSDKESLSSSRFDIKVMIILLSKTSFKEKDVFGIIENLQNHLSRPEYDDRAIKKAIKEINEAAGT